jgi:DNA uptake protein ComE-like DNA-binding protein
MRKIPKAKIPARALRLLAASVLAAAASVACAQQWKWTFAPQQPSTRSRDTSDLLDINTATHQQLKTLPGFGDAYVRRVIAGRPYTAKNQLVTRGILPQPAYDKVSSRIVARHAAR